MKILFLSFTCQDIGVAMVTNMISQLQESFPLKKVVFYVGISLSERYFQHSKIKFVSPRGHVISSISFLVSTMNIDMLLTHGLLYNNNNDNNNNKVTEKLSKYKDLELEMERMWGMKATTIPVVIGALGLIKKGLEKYIQQITGNIKRRSHYLHPKKARGAGEERHSNRLLPKRG